jgi:hypothetical protein
MSCVRGCGRPRSHRAAGCGRRQRGGAAQPLAPEPQGRAAEHFRESRPTAPAATRLLAALARHHRRHADRPVGSCRHARRRCSAARGGRLRPRRTVPALRRRRAGAAAPPRCASPTRSGPDAGRDRGFITACWDVGLEIGSSVRTVAECIAVAERDVTVQTALLESRYLCGSRRVFTTFRHAATRGPWTPPSCAPRRSRCASATSQVRGHALRAGAQLQGKPGRPARPAGGDLGGARRGPGQKLERAGRQGPDHAFEVKQLQRNEGLLKLIRARLHMIAGRREDRLVFDLQTAVAESFGYQSSPGQRASRSADAPLLLGRQGGGAAQPDPDAQHRGASAVRRTRRCGRSTSASSTVPACSRWPATTCTSAGSARDPGHLPDLPAHPRHPGPVGAHAARALQRPRADGRALPGRSGKPRGSSWRSCSSPAARRMCCG